MSLQKQIRRTTKMPLTGSKQLLIDVSVIIHNDAHTGIQRVVRAILLQLFANPPEGYSIYPVYCSRKHSYRYADRAFMKKFGATSFLPEGSVTVGCGDIFFALDLAAHLLPLYEQELIRWKTKGVQIHVLMYDMLPHLHPEWFTARSVKNFNKWLRIVAVYANQVICISESVKNDFKSWLLLQGFNNRTLRVKSIILGSEISASLPSIGIDENIRLLVEQVSIENFILMVGTVEPRKGYDDALNAMEKLWESGDKTSLVIVGKAGWKTDALQERILHHVKFNTKLYWFQNLSDEVLELLYKKALGVLVASKGEGFGLPLIEAMHYKQSLVVRDLPVFREVAKNYHRIRYFSNEELVDKLVLLPFIDEQKDIIIQTWQMCTQSLLDKLIHTKE